MFRKLHTIKEIRQQDMGTQIGRLLVFVVYGGGLGLMAYVNGFPMWVTIIILAGYLFMAMEKREN